MSALQKAIDALGSQAALARVCGQKPQAVTRWVKTGRVPAHHVAQIVMAANGAVTREELRPDVFGPTATQPATPEARAA